MNTNNKVQNINTSPQLTLDWFLHWQAQPNQPWSIASVKRNAFQLMPGNFTIRMNYHELFLFSLKFGNRLIQFPAATLCWVAIGTMHFEMLIIIITSSWNNAIYNPYSTIKHIVETSQAQLFVTSHPVETGPYDFLSSFNSNSCAYLRKRECENHIPPGRDCLGRWQIEEKYWNADYPNCRKWWLQTIQLQCGNDNSKRALFWSFFTWM